MYLHWLCHVCFWNMASWSNLFETSNPHRARFLPWAAAIVTVQHEETNGQWRVRCRLILMRHLMWIVLQISFFVMLHDWSTRVSQPTSNIERKTYMNAKHHLLLFSQKCNLGRMHAPWGPARDSSSRSNHRRCDDPEGACATRVKGEKGFWGKDFRVRAYVYIYYLQITCVHYMSH